MTDRTLYFDFETDGDSRTLKDAGSARYIKEGRPTWIAWAVNDDPVEVWKWSDESYSRFGEVLMGVDRLSAHNAVFDLLVLRYHANDLYRLAEEYQHLRWSCTASIARCLNLPAGLNDLAAAYGLQGKAEIVHGSGNQDLFKQQTEKDWIKYVRQDVELLRTLDREMAPRIKPAEHELIDLHLRMQARGLAVDIDRLNELGKAASRELADIDERFRRLTGLSPSQSVRLRDWFLQEAGIKTASTKELGRADQGGWSAKAKDAFGILMERKKNELARFRKVREICVDGEMPDFLKHASTTTNRWAGQGANLHSFAREGKARSVIIPHKEKQMVVADLSQIEVRVGLWLAGMTDALDDLHSSDWYLNLTKQIYGEDHSPEDMDRFRTRVKQGVIATMYAASPESVHVNAGIPMEDAEFLHREAKARLQPIVKVADNMFKAWCDVASRDEPGYARSVAIGPGEASSILFCRPRRPVKPFNNAMIMLPPVGQIVFRLAGDGERGYYVGSKLKHMKHRGTLFENVASTISREVLAAGLLRLKKMKWYNPVATIHDEVIVEVGYWPFENGEEPSARVRDAMIQPVERLDGLLLNSKSHHCAFWSKGD